MDPFFKFPCWGLNDSFRFQSVELSVTPANELVWTGCLSAFMESSAITPWIEPRGFLIIWEIQVRWVAGMAQELGEQIMKKFQGLILVCWVGGLSGCLPTQMSSTPLVPTNALTSTAQGPEISRELSADARKVIEVGQKLLAANENLTVKPAFILVGKPELEVFHQGNQSILITEGLVQKCTSEDQLAAVLSNELARMVVDQQTKEQFTVRNADLPPPIDLHIGNDFSGPNGMSDGTQQANLARFELEQRKRFAQRLKPDQLALQYLSKANYSRNALEEVTPLLKTASGNIQLEKQFNNNVLKQF